jgi:hypothetical protein
VDLDGDRKAVDANDGGGRDRGEHGNPLCGSEPKGEVSPDGRTNKCTPAV